MTPYEVILQQLGGNKFLAMTGASNLITRGKADLSMKLPRNASRYNWARITLAIDDTYTVEFGRARGLSLVVDVKREMVYADNLREVFEHHTGLRVSL